MMPSQRMKIARDLRNAYRILMRIEQKYGKHIFRAALMKKKLLDKVESEMRDDITKV